MNNSIFKCMLHKHGIRWTKTSFFLIYFIFNQFLIFILVDNLMFYSLYFILNYLYIILLFFKINLKNLEIIF